MTSGGKILSLDALMIGYRSGRETMSLLPPLTAAVMKGELIALLGQNGIGKSTLLRTITALQAPLGGSVTIKDKKIEDYQRFELAKTIGYISTEQVRAAGMKVIDLVSLGRYPHTNWTGRFEDADHLVVAEAIEKTGLERLKERYINELSDGERQRAMIARVLAQDAEILVMDEPTAFLDIRSRYEIVHLLHDLTVNRGKTIIFSTHDMLTAINESDRIWLTFRDSFNEGAPEDLILNGSFDRLFDSSVVKFNIADATFVYQKELKGKVKIEASGISRYWTEKAVNRAGFSVTDKAPGIVIRVTEEGIMKWTVEGPYGSTGFSSVYELVNWLCRSADKS